MGKLTVSTFVTLDGVMQAPGAPGEDPSGAFVQGGWVAQWFDQQGGAFIAEMFGRADAFVLGRRTYEIFADHWPRHRDANDPVATALNTLPKHVASTSLRELHWNNSTLLGRDVLKELAALKRRYPRELQVHGSCGLLQTLLRGDVVDELNVITFPVLLGAGKRLFGPGIRPAAMQMQASRVTPTGVVIATYRPAGPPTYARVDERADGDAR